MNKNKLMKESEKFDKIFLTIESYNYMFDYDFKKKRKKKNLHQCKYKDERLYKVSRPIC